MAIFRAFTFSGKKSASKALDAIEDELDDYDWYDDADMAEISVNKKGHIRVHSTWAQDDSNVGAGIGGGALLGGLIGCLFGPAGAIAGAAYGGSIGGLMADADNIDFADPALDEFAASLVKDSSALVYINDAESVAAFQALLVDYEFTFYEAEVHQATVDALKAKMKK